MSTRGREIPLKSGQKGSRTETGTPAMCVVSTRVYENAAAGVVI